MRTTVLRDTEFKGECGDLLRLPGVIYIDPAKEGQIINIEHVGKVRVTKVSSDINGQQICVRPIE